MNQDSMYHLFPNHYAAGAGTSLKKYFVESSGQKFNMAVLSKRMNNKERNER